MELRTRGKLLGKFDNGRDIIFTLKNAKEHKYLKAAKRV